MYGVGSGAAAAIRDGFCETVGDTPLIRLNWASERSGCEILGKAEFLNPGGSVKDRAALGIIRAAESKGELKPGGLVVEGTAGNTGIGLALVGNQLGYRSLIVMPKTQSIEKQEMVKLCGARLMLTEAVPYRDPKNYIRLSRTLALEKAETEKNGVLWANQFDNLANMEAHRRTTAEEIWRQTAGGVDAFTCAVGTGGTIAGVSRGLKAHNPKIHITLADPHGSGLYSYYACGEIKAEGDSITEGIGQSRITANLAEAEIDYQVRIDDRTCLEVLAALVKKDGLFLGSSSGINVAAAMRVAKELGEGHTIVTILCDGGERYRSKLYNPSFLKEKNLPYLYG